MKIRYIVAMLIACTFITDGFAVDEVAEQIITVEESRSHWPVIIIGAGPAGFTSAIYTARGEIPTLVLSGSGSMFYNAEKVGNWPGEIETSGSDILTKMQAHAEKVGATIRAESVTSVDFTKQPFVITTDAEQTYTADSVIIATGTKTRKLNVPNEDKYYIAACSICDAPFYKDKEVVIVGGGTMALKNAFSLARFTPHITIIQNRPQLTAAADMVKELEKHPEIKILYNHEVLSIEGDDKHMHSITVHNKDKDETFTMKLDGLFNAIGLSPATQLFADQLKLNDHGQIITTDGVKTSVDGVFAAGTTTDQKNFQAIRCAGAGCDAAAEAEEYLQARGLMGMGVNSVYIN